MDAVAKRILTWKAGLLNTAGRLTLTQATLSAIPVHISITCSLSAWAIQQIDKRRRAFSVVRDGFGGRRKMQDRMTDRLHPKMRWWLGTAGHQSSRFRPSPPLGMAEEGWGRGPMDKAAFKAGEACKCHVQLLCHGRARQWCLSSLLD